MSNTDTSGFGKFVPGFDFLQNLAKSASSGLGSTGSSSAVPNLSQWLVPSLSVEDIEKRIEELKHVQFWLDQNSRALSATIQALEVQKMTMQTLKGMNFTMGAPESAPPAAAPASTGWPMPPAAAPKPEPAASAKPAPEPEAPKATEEKPAAGVVDPLQLWGALTQQFQTIAANAFKEVSEKAAPKAPARAKPAAKKTATKKAVSRKAPAKKSATRATAAPTRRRAS